MIIVPRHILYKTKGQRGSFFNNFLCARPVITHILLISKPSPPPTPVTQKKNHLLLLNLMAQPFTSAWKMINPIGGLEIGRSMIRSLIMCYISMCAYAS